MPDHGRLVLTEIPELDCGSGNTTRSPEPLLSIALPPEPVPILALEGRTIAMRSRNWLLSCVDAKAAPHTLFAAHSLVSKAGRGVQAVRIASPRASTWSDVNDFALLSVLPIAISP